MKCLRDGRRPRHRRRALAAIFYHVEQKCDGGVMSAIGHGARHRRCCISRHLRRVEKKLGVAMVISGEVATRRAAAERSAGNGARCCGL